MVSLSSAPSSGPVPPSHHTGPPIPRKTGTGSAIVDSLWTRTGSPDPLLTWYDGPARVELSGRTTGTWVAKTVHLMATEGVDHGATVGLHVARQRPGHWVSAVWVMACWWAGVAAGLSDRGADLAVTGPDASPADPAVPLVQCGLAPLGGPCTAPVPGAIDHVEVLGMPDDLPPAAPGSAETVWWRGHTDLTGRHLDLLDPIGGTVLVDARPADAPPGPEGPSPQPPVSTRKPLTADRLVALLARTLLGGGSLVLVESLPPGLDLVALATQEQARPVN